MIFFSLPEEGYRIGLDFLGKFAQVIIEGVGSIGFGIIVFTLVLKAITLPLDIYQRVKTRKQNLVMKQMQPELEKLQKQYANDKNTYNQKMMELYKKNGYSMFGACLPTIFSLVILIVAFQGFRTYSQYANLSMYENMSSVYNAAILEHAPVGDTYVLVEGNAIALKETPEGEDRKTIGWEKDASFTVNDVTYEMQIVKIPTGEKDEEGKDIKRDVKYLKVSPSVMNGDKFIWYRYSLESQYLEKSYYIDETAVKQNTAIEESVTAKIAAIENFGDLKEEDKKTETDTAYRAEVKKLGAVAVRDWYETEGKKQAKFLWVKNVWYPDVSYKKPIQSYSALKKDLTKKVTLQYTPLQSDEKIITEKKDLDSILIDHYENMTSELTDAKKQPNGYFILIILSIGFMVLSQFISMRSSKESNQYQTVDGQGAKTQKIMMIVMPLIYAIFAFMYSAAFSIYMTMSSVISLLVTVISNLIIGRAFKKKEKAAVVERYSRRYEWQKTEKEKKQDAKREKKAQKLDKKNKK